MTLTADLQPGQVIARGMARHLSSLHHAPLLEFVPTRGLRVDVFSLGPKGEIWIVECKSSRTDFMSDHKWQGYLDWCDRYFWAVDADFPQDLLPPETGLFIADAYGAEMIRAAPEQRLATPRRKSLTLKAARTAAMRLSQQIDPRSPV